MYMSIIIVVWNGITCKDHIRQMCRTDYCTPTTFQGKDREVGLLFVGHALKKSYTHALKFD